MLKRVENVCGGDELNVGSRVPRYQVEIVDVLVSELQANPNIDVLETYNMLAEFSGLGEEASVAEVYDLLESHKNLQELLVAQCLSPDRGSQLEDVVKGHKVGVFIGNNVLLKNALQSMDANSAGMLLEELLIQTRSNSSAQTDVLQCATPELLKDLGEQGVDALRTRYKFNSVPNNRTNRIESTIKAAKRDLEKVLGSAETAEEVLQNLLTYPENAFREQSLTRGGTKVRPFDPQELRKNLNEVDRFLGSVSRYDSDFGRLPTSTAKQILHTLQSKEEFRQLPERYKQILQDIETQGCGLTRDMLVAAFRADILGHKAEEKAKRLIVGMKDLVAGIAWSEKFSDADTQGQDLLVRLKNGRSVYLDIKATEKTATRSELQRSEFCQRSGMPAGLTYVTNNKGSMSIYLLSRICVVDLKLTDEENKKNIREVLTRGHIAGEE